MAQPSQLLTLLLLVSACCLRANGGYYSGGGDDGSSSSVQGFVAAKGSQFSVNGRALYVNGFNAYYLSYVAVDSRSTASQVLQQAAATGLNLCRTWAFNDGAYHAIQLSPGQYDETSFQALDFVLSEASKNGIRVILSLVDNYANMGGKQQYVQWARNAGVSQLSSEDDFFTDPTVKGYFKNYIKAVITRVNSITGAAYKDDPAIFAWELMNEPRCTTDPSGDTLHAWIEEMAAYVKSIDGNHMVEAGLEGFYGPSTPDMVQYNPWEQFMTGTDYVRFAQIPSVDFTTVHSYPDIWLAGSSFAEQVEFLGKWVGSHVDAAAVGKPVVFAEFGFSRGDGGYSDANRDALFAALYGAVYASATAGGAAAGALVWQVCLQGLDSTVASDGYGVFLSPPSSTSALIALQSQRLSALSQ